MFNTIGQNPMPADAITTGNIHDNLGLIGTNFFLEIQFDAAQLMLIAEWKANAFRCPHGIDGVVNMLIHIDIVISALHHV